MSFQQTKLVVFDLDGTLNRTDLYAVEVHQQVQKSLGLPVLDAATIISMFGARSYDCARVLMPGASEEVQKEYYRRTGELELELMKKKSGAYQGTAEMLDTLHQMGCTTAVCSNASSRYINGVLECISLKEKIDTIQPLEYGLSKVDNLRKLIERLNPSMAVMVGDRIFDLEAARGNHIPFIGCSYGYCPKEIEGADIVAASPSEIPAAAEELFRQAAR